MYTSEIHLPPLIKNTLSEYSFKEQRLPWNNSEQLSSLWSIFTKYKSNMRDGFRLENLSWRLWYRQTILKKKQRPSTVKDIDFTTKPTRSLHRSRSLPNLKFVSQKFFIDEPMVIKKKPIRRSSNLPKPVSLLSEMLSRSDTSKKSTGLRRCQSRYCRLDQFFLNA